MAKNAKQVLLGLGFSEEEVTKILTGDDELPEDFTKAARGRITEAIKNDKGFIDPLRSEARGRERGIIDRAIRDTFGLSGDEFKDLKTEELLTKAKEALTKGATATGDELQKKLLEANQRIAKFETEVIPGLQKKATEEISTFRRNSAFDDTVRKIPMIVEPDAVLGTVRERVFSKFDVKIGEDGSLVVKTKDGLNPTDKTGTKVIGLNEILNDELESLKVLKKNNAGGGGNTGNPGKFVEEPGGEPKYNLPGLTKAKENLAAMQEQSKAAKS